MKRLTLRGLALAAIALLCQSLLFQFTDWMCSGPFAADVIYLPLREFVAEEQRQAMESKVMELSVKHLSRPLTPVVVVDALALAAVLALLLRLPGASTGASPHSAN